MTIPSSWAPRVEIEWKVHKNLSPRIAVCAVITGPPHPQGYYYLIVGLDE